MRHLGDVTNAMAATLSDIPQLMAQLAPEAPIVAYIDRTPTNQQAEKAISGMQPGQVLVLWRGTFLTTDNMSKWDHRIDLNLRALPGYSVFDLIDAIMNGVPASGDGMVWLNCGILPGLLPTNVNEITRGTDTETIDYGLISTSTPETGDWPRP